MHLRLVRVSVPHAQILLRLVRGSTLFSSAARRSALSSCPHSSSCSLAPSARMPRNRSTSRRMSHRSSDSDSSSDESYGHPARRNQPLYSFSSGIGRSRSHSPGERPSRPRRALLQHGQRHGDDQEEIEMQPLHIVPYDEESHIGPTHTTSAEPGNNGENVPPSRRDSHSSRSAAHHVGQTAPSDGGPTPTQPARRSFSQRIQWRAIFTTRVSTNEKIQLHSGDPADRLHACLAFHLFRARRCPGKLIEVSVPCFP